MYESFVLSVGNRQASLKKRREFNKVGEEGERSGNRKQLSSWQGHQCRAPFVVGEEPSGIIRSRAS